MMGHKGETSNQLFNVLEEWEKNLKGCFNKSPASFFLTELLSEPSPDILFILACTRVSQRRSFTIFSQ